MEFSCVVVDHATSGGVGHGSCFSVVWVEDDTPLSCMVFLSF